MFILGGECPYKDSNMESLVHFLHMAALFEGSFLPFHAVVKKLFLEYECLCGWDMGTCTLGAEVTNNYLLLPHLCWCHCSS